MFFPIGDFYSRYSDFLSTGTNEVIPLTNTSVTEGYVDGTSGLSAYNLWLTRMGTTLPTRYAVGPGKWAGSAGKLTDLNRMAYNNTDCVTPDSADDCGMARYFKSYENQLVWNWDDEPNLGTDETYVKATDVSPYSGLKEWKEATRSVDTDHPVANVIMGIGNNLLDGYNSRVKTYSVKYSGLTVMDIWLIDYYPYEYLDHGSAPDLIDLAQTVDNALSMNYGLFPVWVMGESEDLHDFYGYITGVWAANTSMAINRQIAVGTTIYRNDSGITCITGAATPSWPAAEGDTVTDGTCVWKRELTRTGSVLNIDSWDSGTFQAGEKICSDEGCEVASAYIGRPREGGSFTQTSKTYVRKPADLYNYQVNQIVLASRAGTWTAGMGIVGQTSEATATTDSSNLFYRTVPWGNEQAEDWTPAPTPDQVKNAAWIPIVHGAKGIAYFPLFSGIQTDVQTAMAEVKTTVEAMKDVLLSPVSTKITPTGYNQWFPATVASGRVDFTVRESSGVVWIFATRIKSRTEALNPWPDPTNTNTISATIPLDYLAGGETVTVYGEGRTLTAAAEGFTDNFTDYDVHIYSVGAVEAPSYSLTVTLAGAGAGTVTSSPAAIDCGSTCTGSFVEDSVITLTATPTGADTFTGWSGDCSGADPCPVTMTAAKNVTATFATAVPPDHIVTISHTGTGTGATDPIAGEHIYAEEAAVSVTQTPTDANMTFTGWSGTCGCTGTGDCSFSMPDPSPEAFCTVIAEWTEDQIYRLDVTPSEHGERITSDIGGIDCGDGTSQTEGCSAVFYAGEEVTLTYDIPVSRENPQFTGACSGQTCVVTMDGDKIVGLNTRNLRPSMGRGGSKAKGGALGTSSAAQIVGN